MSIKLVCKKADGVQVDITEIVEKVTWSGDLQSCARKLEFSILTTKYTYNVPKIDIPVMSMVLFYENGKELFRGFVFERTRDNSNSISFVCYDHAEKLNKIEVAYNGKGKTPSSVMKDLLTKYGFSIGSIASSSVKGEKIYMGTKLYNIFMDMYTQQSKKDNKKYMVHALEGKIYCSVKGTTVLSILFEEALNITNSSFKESVSSMVNKVIIVDQEGNSKGSVVEQSDINTYGLFQAIYKEVEGKDSKEEAKSRLQGIEQTCSISGFGDTTCVTGKGVKVKETNTGLVGLFYIDADVHTWSNGQYTVDLELNFKNIMNEVNTGQEETESSSSSSSGSTGSTGETPKSNNEKINKVVSLAKSKVGNKYVWGATGPNTFDCSGFTSWLYRQVGVSIPRTSAAQSKHGTLVSRSNLQVGDLLFFNTNGKGVSHVGLYIGNGQMVHAANSKKGVRYDDINSSYYKSRFVNARRVV